MSLQIKINTTALREALSKEGLKFIDKAAVRATNRTLDALKTKTKKEIASFLNVPQKYIADRIFTVRATSKSSYARLKVGDKGINLALLSPRIIYVQTRRGRRKAVSIMINGKREIVAGGFLGKGLNGSRFVFSRVGDPRYPIKALYSKGLSDLFDSAGYLSTLESFSRDTFQKNFDSDLAYFIQQARK